MELKNESNHLNEHKKRKKKNDFFSSQNNQVISKIADNKKKMTNNYLKIDPCTSLINNETLSTSSLSTTFMETLHQNTEHSLKFVSDDFTQELQSTLSDLSPSQFSEINGSLKIDESSTTKEVICSSLDNDNKGTALKYKSPVNFIQCEHGDYFTCRLCRKSQLLIDTHRKLCESKLNYLRKFYCAMCDKEMRSLIDWKTHSISHSHIDKSMNNGDYVSYNCGGCKAVFFENQEIVLKHCRTVHNDSSGLPCIFKCMNEVFRQFLTTDPDKQKIWTFCGPCKKYSSIKFYCFSPNHANKKTLNFKCNSCLIDFICNQDVYDKHLISSEHIMLEFLRINKPMQLSNIKLPPVILSRFTIEKDKTTCNECKFQMMSSDRTIASHMNECIVIPDLGGKSKMKITKYFCAVCNETVSDFSQWKFHLICPSHLIKCYDITDLVSYTCELCLLHCYGSSYHVNEHQNIHPNNSEKNLSIFLAFNFQRINNDLKSKDFYYCEDCITFAEVNLNSDHWNKSHKTKLNRIFCQPCRTEFFCIEGNNLYSKHILSSEHIILKFVNSKVSNPEHKPLVKSLKSSSQTDENQLPLITNSYLNWFNIEDPKKAVCLTCEKQIEMNDDALLTHLLVCNQNPKNYIPNINMEFFKCLECSFYCKNYFAWQKHAILHSNLISCGLYSYFCNGCTSLLYGRMNDIESHLHKIHNTTITDMPLITVLLTKQLMRRNNNGKSSEIMCFCEPCNMVLNTTEDNNHFNKDSHVSIVVPDIIELFYCEYCQIELYSSFKVYEFHKLTAEHIILSMEKINTKPSPKLSKLDTYIFKFINNRYLYNQTQNTGFFCFICDYLCFTLDVWTIHISGKDHINSAKDHCIDHHCTICKTLIFGKRHDIFEHYRNRFHSMIRNLKCINIQNKNGLLLQTNYETKQVYNIEITENNQIAATDNSLLEESTKIMNKLSIESNTQQDNNNIFLGLEEPTTDIEKTPENLTDSIRTNTQTGVHLLKECTANINETTTNESISSPNTQNYSHFYVFKINMLKELLNQNKEIGPQFVFYCATCDFITTIQKYWDEHNATNHSNDVAVRHPIFCDVCNLYQFGPPGSLEKHKKTTEHLNMVDFQKNYISNNNKTMSNITNEKNNSKSTLFSKNTKEKYENKRNVVTVQKLREVIDLINNSIYNKTNECENKSNLISDKTSITIKQEIHNRKDEYEVNNRKITIEIKGVKPDYRVNSWVELKRILSVYGNFRIYPKYNSAIIIYRKLSCMYLMLKDREELEKKHKFTIVVHVEEEKLPELSKSTEYEFSNKEFLLIVINKLLVEINEEITNPNVYNRLFLLMNSVHQCADSSIYFRYGKTYAFGSRMSGLALKNSDVDLYFDIGGAFTGLISNDLNAQEDLVRYFGKVFRSQSNDFKHVQQITGARVPIVKFYHAPSNLNCDLSFKSGLSTHNTKLVRLYLTLDSRVHWMVCAVVKRWALQNDLKNQSMFTSYALVWLVIFYLMIVHVVPPLKLLREHATVKTDVMFIEDWDCTFCSPEIAKEVWQVPEIPCWDLLFGFFKFYADSDRLRKFVLCPTLGEIVLRETFFNLPAGNKDLLGFYKKKTGDTSQQCLKLRNNFSGEGLALQDPFDLFHNITKTIVPRKLLNFSYLCGKTLEIMDDETHPYYA